MSLSSRTLDMLKILLKGKALPVGTIRMHGGKKVRKTADNKWVPVKEIKKQEKKKEVIKIENIIDNKSLKKWFGKSKVVDLYNNPSPKEKIPLLSLHGSPLGAKIKTFDKNKQATGTMGKGFYFTDLGSVASRYARDEAIDTPVINILNGYSFYKKLDIKINKKMSVRDFMLLAETSFRNKNVDKDVYYEYQNFIINDVSKKLLHGKVIPVFLKMEKPFVYNEDFRKSLDNKVGVISKKIIKHLKKMRADYGGILGISGIDRVLSDLDLKKDIKNEFFKERNIVDKYAKGMLLGDNDFLNRFEDNIKKLSRRLFFEDISNNDKYYKTNNPYFNAFEKSVARAVGTDDYEQYLYEKKREVVESLGFDGIIMDRNSSEYGNEFVIFEPNQAKSIYSKNFDPKEDNIYKSSKITLDSVLKARGYSVGTQRTHKDGSVWEKVNTTGNRNKDWKMVKGGKTRRDKIYDIILDLLYEDYGDIDQNKDKIKALLEDTNQFKKFIDRVIDRLGESVVNGALKNKKQTKKTQQKRRRPSRRTIKLVDAFAKEIEKIVSKVKDKKALKKPRTRNSIEKKTRDFLQSLLAEQEETAIGEKMDTATVEIARKEYYSKPDENFITGDYKDILQDYQKDAVNLALEGYKKGEKGFLNFDGTGTGKTVQQLVLADTYIKENKKPVIIVSESKLILEKAFIEDNKNILGNRVHLNSSMNGYIAKDKVNLITYDALSKLKEEDIKNMGLVVFDEAHNLKNQTSIKAIHGMELMNNAKHNACFTATPSDKIEHLHYIESSLGKEAGYFEKEIKQGKKRFPSIDVVVDRLRSAFDKIAEDKNMVRREVPLKNTRFASQNIEVDKEKLDKIEAEKSALKRRLMLESVKVKPTVDLVTKKLSDNPNKKIVVFAESVTDTEGKQSSIQALMKEFKDKGINATKLTGEMGSKEKSKSVTSFQEGDAQVFITTSGSGGTGISLDDQVGDSPRDMIILTPPLTANDLGQMVGRINRLKTKSKTGISFMQTGSNVDNWNKLILDTKLKVMGASTEGTNEELKKEFTALKSIVFKDKIYIFKTNDKHLSNVVSIMKKEYSDILKSSNFSYNLLYDMVIKAKALAVGATTQRKDGVYKKTAEGKFEKVTEDSVREEDVREDKDAKDTDDVFENLKKEAKKEAMRKMMKKEEGLIDGIIDRLVDILTKKDVVEDMASEQGSKLRKKTGVKNIKEDKQKEEPKDSVDDKIKETQEDKEKKNAREEVDA